MMDRRSVALTQAACADLLDRLGSSSVFVGQAARDMIGGGDGDDPVAVARPADAREVSIVLRVARSRHLPVICRARLPAQHPSALRGAIVLDASGLDRPPAIDTSRQLVTVGAAVPLDQIDTLPATIDRLIGERRAGSDRSPWLASESAAHLLLVAFVAACAVAWWPRLNPASGDESR